MKPNRVSSSFLARYIVRVVAVTCAAYASCVAPPRLWAQAPIELTGSRIERPGPLPVQPVTLYSAADIAAKGYSTLGEYMQSLPVNAGALNTEFTTMSPITGAVTMNPRGLGSSRTLTLVNGRRPAPYALVDSTPGMAQLVFNYNSIPVAAVDHIEFLKDGGSAIYGSDAMVGVFNVVLKKNYSGTFADAAFSNTLKHDSLVRRFSAFTGFADQKWDISVGVAYESRHSTRIQDFGLSTNYAYLGVKGRNFLQAQAYPATVSLSAAQSASAGMSGAGYYVVNGGIPTANPTRASFAHVGTSSANIPDVNRYDAAKDHEVFPRREAAGTMASFSRHFAGGVTGYANILFNRSHSDTSVYPFGVSVIPPIPASNPYNPFGVPITTYYYRTGDAVYHRLVDEKTVTSDAGLQGAAGAWKWRAGVNYSRDNALRQTDQIRTEDLAAALNGTTRETALNVFGPSGDSGYPAKLFTRSRDSDNNVSMWGAEVLASARLWQIPIENAGSIGVATGYEFLRQKMVGKADPWLYIGMSSTTAPRPSNGHRETQSVTAEMSLPIQRWLEIQLAGRHEEYTDVGHTTVPKIGAMLHLPRTGFVTTILRGSYSESFKAPDLALRNQAPLQLTWSAAMVDPFRPQDGPQRFGALFGGNPGLKPEKSRSRYVGAVFDFVKIKGLGFNVDYLDIRMKDVIVTASPAAALPQAFLLAADTQARIPANIVRDNSQGAPGPILYLRASSANLASQLYRGVDYTVSYSRAAGRFGTFAFQAEATQILRMGSADGRGGSFRDFTGRHPAPKWRESAVASWQGARWGASIAADIMGSYFNDSLATPGWGEKAYAIVHPMMWLGGWRGLTFTVGANNVFDRRPPPNGLSTFLYRFDDRVYGPGALGRAVYLKVRKQL